MSHAFQSFTPRVLPMDYDSLEGETGCQTIAGNDAGPLKAFEQFCAAEESALEVFLQPDSAGYCKGPQTSGDPHTYLWDWAAWQGTAGIRVGHYSLVTPPDDTLGGLSTLYPDETAAGKVSCGFNLDGLFRIAIQSSANVIEMKWYATDDPDDIAFHSWQGQQALIVGMGELIPGNLETAVIYLRDDKPRYLFARLLSDLEQEYTLHNRLPATLTRLIHAQVANQKLVLYAEDERGFDITITSPSYPVETEEAQTLEVSIVDGLYFESLVEAPDQAEEATLTLTIAQGAYADVVIEAPALAGEEATLTLAIVGGSYYIDS